jgi:ABC-type branched-subunit amino acid transport system ATPase component
MSNDKIIFALEDISISFGGLQDISISFGGLQAVSDCSFNIHDGEIFSLIGPNGAGKTTIFNIINALYKPDSGRVLLEGEDLVFLKPYQIAKRGIARTFQNIELFAEMSVLESNQAYLPIVWRLANPKQKKPKTKKRPLK